MKWRWLFVQVAIPVIGPIVLSAIVAAAWATGNPGFTLRWDIIADVTPRALTFYNLALISVTVSEFWRRLGDNPFIGWMALLTGAAVAVYHSFTVVWRHDAAYFATAETYYVSVFLTFVSVFVCYLCQREMTR